MENEKILIKHDTEGEQWFLQRIDNVCQTLSRLNNVWQFNSVQDIPNNTRQWGVSLHLESDTIAKELKRLNQLDEAKIVLPVHIQTIIGAMNAAKEIDRNLFQFLTKDEAGSFAPDSDKIGAHVELMFKEYLTLPEQIARYKRAESLIALLKPELDLFDWDYNPEPGKKYFLGCYWLRWNIQVNRFQINMDWVKSGDLSQSTGAIVTRNRMAMA